MVFDAAQIYVVSPLPVPMHKHMNIIMVACLEWWNSHFIIRCSFETGHWRQIPQVFPTLWRMLMSRIQHLRTRLPVHIGFVPVKKPGEEAKDKYASCEQKFFSQCPDIQQHLLILMEGPCHFSSPSFAETYPNSKLQTERSSFLHDISTHDIYGHHSSCHIKVCYTMEIKHISAPRGRGATTFKPRQPRFLTVLTLV